MFAHLEFRQMASDEGMNFIEQENEMLLHLFKLDYS